MKYLFGKSKKKGSFQQFLCSVWESLVAFCTISSLGRGKMMRLELKLMKKYKAGDWSQSWCQETQKNTQRYRALSSPRLCTGTTLYQYEEQIDHDQKLGQASGNSVRWQPRSWSRKAGTRPGKRKTGMDMATRKPWSHNWEIQVNNRTKERDKILALGKTPVMRNEPEHPKTEVCSTVLARRTTEEPWTSSRTAPVTWGVGKISRILGPVFRQLQRAPSPSVIRSLTEAKLWLLGLFAHRWCLTTKRKKVDSCRLQIRRWVGTFPRQLIWHFVKVLLLV